MVKDRETGHAAVHGVTTEQHEQLNNNKKGFPGGPVVKTLLPNAQGTGLISGKGAKISHAEWRGGKNKEASHQFTSIIKSGSEFQFSAQSLSHV